jgi:hypothetical protein
MDINKGESKNITNEEIDYLDHVLEKLHRAKDTLNYSYGICKQVGVKDSYEEEEKDRLESLSSKFARLADLILKQVFKTIDMLDLEEPAGTIRDAINRAEKKGLISSALEFVKIKKMRNKISHEYVEPEDLLDIYKFVLEYTPLLFDTVERIELYCRRFKQV